MGCEACYQEKTVGFRLGKLQVVGCMKMKGLFFSCYIPFIIAVITCFSVLKFLFIIMINGKNLALRT